MTTELQNKAWRVLPAEFRKEVKKVARIYSGRTSALFGAERHLANKFLDEFIGLFGHDNLTSDAEGERMLAVEVDLVKELYQRAKEVEEESKRIHSPLVAAKYCGVQRAIEYLFDSKCLPDDTNLSEKLTGSEPKFRKDEKVRIKGVAGFDVIKAIYGTGKDGYRYELVNEIAIYDESDLEPYTVPEKESPQMKPIESKVSVYLATKEEDEEFRLLLHQNGFTWNTSTSLISLTCWTHVFEDDKVHYVYPDKTVTYCGEKTSDTLTFSEFKKQYFGENVNLSQETANCDKQFDTILKDSFRNHNRLQIAAMAMQGILSNSDWRGYRGGNDQEVGMNIAKASFGFADALLTEFEKEKNG